jgi:hypothetical protein
LPAAAIGSYGAAHRYETASRDNADAGRLTRELVERLSGLIDEAGAVRQA